MVKLIAAIRPNVTESFAVEAEARVPDGYELVSVRADKS